MLTAILAWLFWAAVVVLGARLLWRHHVRQLELHARRHAEAHWQRQQMEKHPWEREAEARWVGTEEPHRPSWSRKLKLVVKDTYWKEQPKAVFKRRTR